MASHQRPVRTIYDILSLTISTLLTTDTICVVQEKSYSHMMIFVSFSIEKAIIPYSYSVPLPHLTTCRATKYDSYLSNSLATVVNEPDLLWAPNIPCNKCHISFPLLRSYQRSVQARGTCIRFVPKSGFSARGC
jgi:hypothetical protein